MKATLEYTLPDEREEHRLATVAPQLAQEIIDLDNSLRLWQKHGTNFATPAEAIDRIRAMLADAVALARGE